MLPFPLTGADALQVSSWNALASVRLTIRGYTRAIDGRVAPLNETHLANTDRTINSTVHPLPEGELRALTVFVTGAAPIIGQTFVRLQIIRGLASSGIVLASLAADYVTAVQPLAVPGSPVKRSVEGPGAIRSITGTNPAPGAEIIETVPTGARWRVQSMQTRLVTSATVGTRQPRLRADDGVTTFAAMPQWLTQAASLTRDYAWLSGAPNTAVVESGLGAMGIPSFRLLAGHRLRTETVGFDADDDWAAPQLLVEEWLEGAA